MRQEQSSARILLGLASSLLTGAVAFVALAYVRTGRRGQKSPLIPTQLERRLDKGVLWLDAKLGRVWVDRGMDALESVLHGTGPDNLVQLLQSVCEATAAENHKKPDEPFKLSRFALHLGRN